MFDPVECLRLVSLDFPPLADCSHALLLPDDKSAAKGAVMVLSIFGEIGHWPDGKPSRAFVTVYLDAQDMLKHTDHLVDEIRPMIQRERERQAGEFQNMLLEQLSNQEKQDGNGQ